MKTILVPNQIAPRVAAECFRFDCLSQPNHKCCAPHPAIKRHTDNQLNEEEDAVSNNGLNYINSRVTATITRVLKSISWL